MSLSLFSCKKYLEVSPKSSLSEDQLFNSEVGFQQALTGVYSQLATQNLYGDNLTMGFVSALAQNYANTATNAPLYETSRLNYISAEVIGKTTGIWNTAYTAIAGVNKIIENTEKRRDVLSASNYALIRGESLGIRALLHFDLLRLFGPEYITGASAKSIPYKTVVNENSNVPATSQEVANAVLADLKEAATLLKTNDPILSTSPGRRIKMNYFAVKGLEARVNIYIGDKTTAASAALEVVNSAKFPFVTSTAASAAATSRDRLYITEQLFMVRVRDIANWADPGYFKFNGSTSMKLTRSATNFATLYETAAGGGTDFRFLYRIEQDQGSPFPSKYWQTYQFNTLDSNRLDQNTPAIRLSEMYYILAETAGTTAQGVAYLNAVRKNRGLPDLATTITQTVLNNEITKEYQKEFYAEGQLFYYYKRKNIIRMQFMTADIPLSKYVLPKPPAELEYNPTY
jgi:hypothetical protein